MSDDDIFLELTRSELGPLDVRSVEFARHPTVDDLLAGLVNVTPGGVDRSARAAAGFLLHFVLRQRRRRWWRSDDYDLKHVGRQVGRRARRLGISAAGVDKIRGALRRPAGERVYHIYLNRPDLQHIYPLGLMPLGQAHFISWLATHGRDDFGLRNEEILWFFFQSASELHRGLVLTYLIRPTWQAKFPDALTPRGWKAFVHTLHRAFGRYFPARKLRRFPAELALSARFQIERGRSGRDLRGANIMSHFCNPSGLQQAALWTKAALERAGLQTSCRDVPVPRHYIPPDREKWLGVEIHPVTILTHAATPYFLNAYERAGLHRRSDVYRIAYWAWELEAVPDDWIESAQTVDEIWSPTPFVADAMRRVMPRPVFEMLPGVEIGAMEPVKKEDLGSAGGRFVFLFMFDLHSQIHRKNPGAVVAAFRRAFDASEPVTLVIKATGGDIFKDDFEVLEEICRAENVVLIHEVMSRARAYGMVAMCDCFVSLHRSEGFGLGLAEAMLLGKPVIATGYSGNLAFMNHENSMLVDYEMVEITEDRPVYTKGNRWAEPSVEHAAQLMREVFDDREAAFAKARRVQPEIADLLSLEAAGRRMRDRLEQIMRERGQPIAS
ncbi:MAG: glycosyltransferase [Chthoniobacterales bacterium]